jgi:hypothetical protein
MTFMDFINGFTLNFNMSTNAKRGMIITMSLNESQRLYDALLNISSLSNNELKIYLYPLSNRIGTRNPNGSLYNEEDLRLERNTAFQLWSLSSSPCWIIGTSNLIVGLDATSVERVIMFEGFYSILDLIQASGRIWRENVNNIGYCTLIETEKTKSNCTLPDNVCLMKFCEDWIEEKKTLTCLERGGMSGFAYCSFCLSIIDTDYAIQLDYPTLVSPTIANSLQSIETERVL